MEKAWADVEATRLMQIPAELIHAIWDPYACPYNLLPFLAWAMGVNYWNNAWLEDTRREWIARQWTFKSLRGKANGIRMALDYAGRNVTPYGYPVDKIVRRPLKAFAGKTTTKEEREAWLVRMPQLRLYRYNDLSTARHGIFLGAREPPEITGNGKFYPGHRASREATPRLSDAVTRYGTKGFYYNPMNLEVDPLTVGTEVPTPATAMVENTYAVRIPGNAGLDFVCGRPIRSKAHDGQPTVLGAKLLGQLYNVTIDDTYDYTIDTLNVSTIQPSLTPIDTRFIYVQQFGKRQKGSLFARHDTPVGKKQTLSRIYLPLSTARYRLYQRIYLFDPTQLPPLHGARAFADHWRLGIAAFTAEVSVIVINKRTKLRFGRFVHGFPLKHDQSGLDNVLAATRAAKTLRDKVLIRIGLYQPPTYGIGIPMDGSYSFGDRILGGP